jgi:hypothetical protein
VGKNKGTTRVCVCVCVCRVLSLASVSCVSTKKWNEGVFKVNI